jgi:Flp pilus assembly protein protease CpaA
MIAKVIDWLWLFPGQLTLVVSFCAFVFNWIHIGDVKSFITLMVAAITGISKVIIMWAEKGDVVMAKWRRLINKCRRIKP